MLKHASMSADFLRVVQKPNPLEINEASLVYLWVNCPYQAREAPQPPLRRFLQVVASEQRFSCKTGTATNSRL